MLKLNMKPNEPNDKKFQKSDVDLLESVLENRIIFKHKLTLLSSFVVDKLLFKRVFRYYNN